MNRKSAHDIFLSKKYTIDLTSQKKVGNLQMEISISTGNTKFFCARVRVKS